MSPCFFPAAPIPSRAAEPSGQLLGKVFSLLGSQTAGSVRFGTVGVSSAKAGVALGLRHAKAIMLGQQLEAKAVQAAGSLRQAAKGKSKQPALAVFAVSITGCPNSKSPYVER
jgi:hypothetical protein